MYADAPASIRLLEFGGAVIVSGTFQIVALVEFDG